MTEINKRDMKASNFKVGYLLKMLKWLNLVTFLYFGKEKEVSLQLNPKILKIWYCLKKNPLSTAELKYSYI